MENNENAKVFTEEELQAKKDLEEMRASYCSQAAIQGYHTGYSSPREYLHNFLLQARSAGCHVDSYIDDEVKLLLAELKR